MFNGLNRVLRKKSFNRIYSWYYPWIRLWRLGQKITGQIWKTRRKGRFDLYSSSPWRIGISPPQWYRSSVIWNDLIMCSNTIPVEISRAQIFWLILQEQLSWQILVVLDVQNVSQKKTLKTNINLIFLKVLLSGLLLKYTYWKYWLVIFNSF